MIRNTNKTTQELPAKATPLKYTQIHVYRDKITNEFLVAKELRILIMV